LSIIYIFFHAIAAKYNEAVGVVRPPELRLHAACFILARVVLVLWLVAFIAGCVVLSKPQFCYNGNRDCHFEIVDIVASILAVYVVKKNVVI